MIEISGKVTDFNNNPIEGAEIDIKNDKFETVYQTYSKIIKQRILSIGHGIFHAIIIYD
jgi:hypothetical protein